MTEKDGEVIMPEYYNPHDIKDIIRSGIKLDSKLHYINFVYVVIVSTIHFKMYQMSTHILSLSSLPLNNVIATIYVCVYVGMGWSACFIWC